jgi:hypothetical protein
LSLNLRTTTERSLVQPRVIGVTIAGEKGRRKKKERKKICLFKKILQHLTE